MEQIAIVLTLLAAVVASGTLARATKLALPLVQIIIGIGIALSPLKTTRLNPEVFFVLFLPPLLFLDGWRIPKRELFRHRLVILELALGLVVLTVVGVGYWVHWLIPAMPLPIAFALAAILSPTDPIAVSAVAARTPIPLRLMHILEGESLLNDASGLVCMRFAVAAMLTGAFSLSGAALSFLWVAFGGLITGALVTWIVAQAKGWASAQLGEDAGAQILVSLLIPFAAYLIAERLHCSGILAAVAAGATMSLTETPYAGAATRVRQTAVWDTVQLAVSGAIFVLLGEQLPEILSGARVIVRDTGHAEPWRLAFYVLAIVAALAILRFAWVFTSLRLTWFRAGLRGQPRRKTPMRLVVAMSLAGVRGAITLAGVLTLPFTLNDGTPFPARSLAIFLAAGVILVSLGLATFFLPPILRSLELPPEPRDLAAEERVRREAAEAAIRAVQARERAMAESGSEADLYAEASARVMETYRQRISADTAASAAAPWARRKSLERELRIAGFRAEREYIFRAGRAGLVDEVTTRKLVREVDLAEARYRS